MLILRNEGLDGKAFKVIIFFYSTRRPEAESYKTVWLVTFYRKKYQDTKFYKNLQTFLCNEELEHLYVNIHLLTKCLSIIKLNL